MRACLSIILIVWSLQLCIAQPREKPSDPTQTALGERIASQQRAVDSLRQETDKLRDQMSAMSGKVEKNKIAEQFFDSQVAILVGSFTLVVLLATVIAGWVTYDRFKVHVKEEVDKAMKRVDDVTNRAELAIVESQKGLFIATRAAGLHAPATLFAIRIADASRTVDDIEEWVDCASVEVGLTGNNGIREEDGHEMQQLLSRIKSKADSSLTNKIDTLREKVKGKIVSLDYRS